MTFARRRFTPALAPKSGPENKEAPSATCSAFVKKRAGMYFAADQVFGAACGKQHFQEYRIHDHDIGRGLRDLVSTWR